MNKIALAGRLTKDPVLKPVVGKSVVTFSLAVKGSVKNKDGEYEPDYFECVAFNGQADVIAKYTKKGDFVSIGGKMTSRSYTAKDGTNRKVWEVVVDDVDFVRATPVENAPMSANDLPLLPEEETANLPF